jgi:two-component system sensor histidine kinase YesM
MRKKISTFFGLFSIRTKFIMLLIPTITLPLSIVSATIQKNFSDYMTEGLISSLHNDSVKINIKFQDLVERTNKISLDIISRNVIQNSLLSDQITYSDSSQIATELLNMKTMDIASIVYIDNKKNAYTTDKYEAVDVKSLEQSKLYEYLNATSGKMVWWFGEDILDHEADASCIFAARKINHLNFSIPPGTLIFRIKADIIKNFMSTVTAERKKYYFIADSYGNTILAEKDGDYINQYLSNHSANKLLKDSEIEGYIGKINRIKTLVTYNSDNSIAWNILGIAPYSDVMMPIKKTQRFILWITIISTLIACTMAIFFAFSFTKPIHLLIRKIRRVGTDHYEIPILLKRKDEFGELAESFNRMMLEITTLLNNVKAEQEHAKIAELNLLMDQINPHFLYNTLDNINMLAQASNEKKISLLITSLSKLLRLGLSKGDKVIEVRDEIAHVVNFLIIQKIRFGDIFSYEINLMEDELLSGKVMKIILQPLVENCIIHGFQNMREGGMIKINVYRDQNDLIFEVIDNGKGIEEDKLKALNEAALYKASNRDMTVPVRGYGLYNINMRIRMFYGERYGLTLENNLQGGFISRVTIPFITES